MLVSLFLTDKSALYHIHTYVCYYHYVSQTTLLYFTCTHMCTIITISHRQICSISHTHICLLLLLYLSLTHISFCCIFYIHSHTHMHTMSSIRSIVARRAVKHVSVKFSPCSQLIISHQLTILLNSAYHYTVPAHGKVIAMTDLQIALPDGCYGRIGTHYTSYLLCAMNVFRMSCCRQM